MRKQIMTGQNDLLQQKDWRDSEPYDGKRYQEFFDLLRGSLVFVILTICGLTLFYFADKSLIGGYWTNIISTLLGAVLTIVILDKRNENRSIKQRREELILQMGSPNNGFAVESARLLGLKKWLYDGSLQRANLTRADLRGANLQKANLEKVLLLFAQLDESTLWNANLKGAELSFANLTKARLDSAELDNAQLQGAHLEGASLEAAQLSWADMAGAFLEDAFLTTANFGGANLYQAKLNNANLLETDLRGTNMNMAVLSGAKNIEYAVFSEDTVLPDGKNWTLGRNMREFTHPQEWKAEQISTQPKPW